MSFDLMMKPVAFIRTCFPKKNATPRQGSVLPLSKGIIEFDPLSSFFQIDNTSGCAHHSLDGLQHYSHLWLIFHFHQNRYKTADKPKKPSSSENVEDTETVPLQSEKQNVEDEEEIVLRPKIRPPRMNGKQKIGIFATRTPHRPNPLGLTLAKIDKVEIEKKRIFVSEIDLIDGTPIFDVKPYIPFYDMPKSFGAHLGTTFTNQQQSMSDGKSSEGLEKCVIKFEPKEEKIVEKEEVFVPKWTISPPIEQKISKIVISETAKAELNEIWKKQIQKEEDPSENKKMKKILNKKGCFFFENVEEIEEMIQDLLKNDPRSTYRRKKCVDKENDIYWFHLNVNYKDQIALSTRFLKNNDEDIIAEVFEIKHLEL